MNDRMLGVTCHAHRSSDRVVLLTFSRNSLDSGTCRVTLRPYDRHRDVQTHEREHERGCIISCDMHTQRNIKHAANSHLPSRCWDNDRIQPTCAGMSICVVASTHIIASHGTASHHIASPRLASHLHDTPLHLQHALPRTFAASGSFATFASAAGVLLPSPSTVPPCFDMYMLYHHHAHASITACDTRMKNGNEHHITSHDMT